MTATVPSLSRVCVDEMADCLLELPGELKLTDVTDRVRVATETLYDELINAEATEFIGAAWFERTSDCVAQHNRTRPRALTTTTGEPQLKIPKLRQRNRFSRDGTLDRASTSTSLSRLWHRRWALGLIYE